MSRANGISTANRGDFITCRIKTKT
jgi:hypothetical protein